MLELPEITTLAAQLRSTVPGKDIRQVTVLSSPHKFAFLNRPADEYPRLLANRKIDSAQSRGNYILLHLDSGLTLVLGDMGGRLLFHKPGETLPTKHQLLIQFSDLTSLTLTLQMWGAILLLDSVQLSTHSRLSRFSPAPLDDAFTADHFRQLIASVPTSEQRSLKFYVISQFGLPGVGNGCLHDILFNAGLHPKFPLANLTPALQHNLWQAARETLQRMTAAGGRSSEHDLMDAPGGYVPILSNDKVGTPCPVCGFPIERITYLGGASFFCPHHQKL